MLSSPSQELRAFSGGRGRPSRRPCSQVGKQGRDLVGNEYSLGAGMSRQMDREHQKRWSKEQIFGKWVVVATTGGHRLHTHAHSPRHTQLLTHSHTLPPLPGCSELKIGQDGRLGQGPGLPPSSPGQHRASPCLRSAWTLAPRKPPLRPPQGHSLHALPTPPPYYRSKGQELGTRTHVSRLAERGASLHARPLLSPKPQPSQLSSTPSRPHSLEPGRVAPS